MKKDAIIKRQQEIVNLAKAEKRDLTAEEKKEFDSLQKELDAIEAEERVKEREAKVRRAENERITEIMTMCRQFNVDATSYIADTNMTVDMVRAEVMKELIKNNGPVNVTVTKDEGDKFREAAVDALLMRSGMTIERPSEGAREFGHISLKALADECLEREMGYSSNKLRYMSDDEKLTILSRTYLNPTAAFPAILDSAINKKIVDVYSKVPTTFEAFTTKGSVADFKETKDRNYVMGGGSFEKLPEGGEIKQSKLKTEALPTRKVETYATQFTMSREAFVNDDIGFITRIPAQYAVKMKTTINRQVYELLVKNTKKIFDGKVLFHNDHNNIISSGAKPTLASVSEMMMKLQLQKDPFGEAIYNIPRIVVLPVGFENDLKVVLNSTSIKTTDNDYTGYNPMQNSGMQFVADPIINELAGEGALPWFIVADTSLTPGIQVDYLNGVETPKIRRMEVAGRLGFVWDIYGDWGINVLDYRGIVKNNGTTL